MGSTGRDERTAHVLVIPLITHGHITPTLRLAKELARRGLAITFVSFEDEITRLTTADTSSELESLGFRLIGLEKPVFDNPEETHEIPYKTREAFEPMLEKLLHNKRSGVAGPSCILSDMFLPWTQDVAEKLEIPRYAFVTSGVIFAKAMQCFQDLFGHRLAISETADEIVKYEGLVCNPGLFPLRYHELPSPILEYPAEFQRRCKSLLRSTGVLVNSFYDMEEDMIESWTMPEGSGSEHTKVPKIFPVGPFFSTSFTVPDIKIVHRLEDSASKSLLWLGSQPPSSVLYVAFGTESRLSPRNIYELALGLEESNQRFLWVLPQSKVSSDKESPSITDLFPPGFEARVGDHGCIVTGWVPQLQILAHSATAAFLTHSGWNSTLESVMFGLPMISWPQWAEQHLNCRYVVDNRKIAHQLQTGPDNILDRKEFVRALRLLMVESEGKAIRRRVEELQKKGASAVAEGGSRSRTLQELVDDIKLL